MDIDILKEADYAYPYIVEFHKEYLIVPTVKILAEELGVSAPASILAFLWFYRQKYNKSPTYEEICLHLGIKTTSKVVYHIKKLKDVNLVLPNSKADRSLTPVIEHKSF